MKLDETEEPAGTQGLGSVLPTLPQAGLGVSVGMGTTGAHDPYTITGGRMSVRVCTRPTVSPCPRECNSK